MMSPMEWALVLVSLAFLGVAAVSRRLVGTPITPAMLFVGFGLLLAAAAAGLNETLSLWLSLLIVAVVVLLIALVLVLLARRFARAASPPVPSQAVDEARRTADTLKTHA